MQIDYLIGGEGRVHAINCQFMEGELTIGILCLMAFPETTCRITNDQHAFVVELPKSFCSGSERIKVFNPTLNVLTHEQV